MIKNKQEIEFLIIGNLKTIIINWIKHIKNDNKNYVINNKLGKDNLDTYKKVIDSIKNKYTYKSDEDIKLKLVEVIDGINNDNTINDIVNTRNIKELIIEKVEEKFKALEKVEDTTV